MLHENFCSIASLGSIAQNTSMLVGQTCTTVRKEELNVLPKDLQSRRQHDLLTQAHQPSQVPSQKI